MSDLKDIEKKTAWKPAILSWLIPLVGFLFSVILSYFSQSVSYISVMVWMVAFCVGLIFICLTFVKSRKHSNTLIHGVIGAGFYILIIWYTLVMVEKRLERSKNRGQALNLHSHNAHIFVIPRHFLYTANASIKESEKIVFLYK